MQKAQYGILRFAKYKGPEIGNIEAHNERTKEKYASNPDVDLTRTKYNFHLIEPQGRYRAAAEKQIAEAGCKTRKDSVRLVEALITASPEFFKGKKRADVKEYFEYALKFIQAHQSPETIVSAVVHMDEKTPHMHLTFVPLTADGRLSAKEIIGNKKKLTWWQDEFWRHMVKKYPDLERGESASTTGREHIPPRLFKQAVHLNRQRDIILQTLKDITPFNAGRKSAEVAEMIEKYISGAEDMRSALKGFEGEIKALKAENARLEKDLDVSKESIQKRLEINQKLSDYEDLKRTVEAIPTEILAAYSALNATEKTVEI